MAFQVTVTPRETFADGSMDVDALRRAANPIVEIEGTADPGDVENGSVTDEKTHIGAHFYAVDTSTTDAYAIAYPADQAPSAYADGQLYYFKAGNANTGACTLAVNALAAKAIKLPDGSTPLDGAIPGAGYVHVQYAAAADCFYLLSASCNPGILRAVSVTATHTTVLGVTTTSYNIRLAPFLSAIPTGLVIHGIIDAANQGAVVIVLEVTAVSGTGTTSLASKPLKKFVSTAMAANDLTTGMAFAVAFDATNFQLLTPVAAPTVPVPPRDLGRNIVMTWLSATTFRLTADELVLKNADGNGYVATAVNVTIDMAVNGPNGLEYASGGAPQAVAASTLYWGWVIFNGTTVAGLASLSKVSPELGSSYTYKALVAAIRTSSGTNLIETYFRSGTYAIKDSATLPVIAGVRTFLHPFDQTPSYFRVTAQCNTTDAGFAALDEVPIENLRNLSNYSMPYLAYANYTGVRLVPSNTEAAAQGIYHATTGVFTALTEANWSAKAYFRE